MCYQHREAGKKNDEAVFFCASVTENKAEMIET